MQTPKGYVLPPTAPTSEWSAIRHGGHSVCVAASAMVVNLPIETFREGDTTLASALSTLEPLDGANHVRPPASLVATRQLAGMLLHSHAACTATTGKRKRDGNEHRRQDVARRTFKVRKDEWSSVTLERCVFLLEELRADAGSEAVLGVRLWKVALDHSWRESRSFGLQMLEHRACVPGTPAELLHRYRRLGTDDQRPLIDDFGEWLRGQPDWATRSLMC